MADLSPAGDAIVCSGPAAGYRLQRIRLADERRSYSRPIIRNRSFPSSPPTARRSSSSVAMATSTGSAPTVTISAGSPPAPSRRVPALAPGSAWFQRRPHVSPDGRRIAYIAEQTGMANVHVMDIDGTHHRRLANRASPCGRVRWSPDGRQIAFVSFEGKYPQLFVVPAEGGEPRSLPGWKGPCSFWRGSPRTRGGGKLFVDHGTRAVQTGPEEDRPGQAVLLGLRHAPSSRAAATSHRLPRIARSGLKELVLVLLHGPGSHDPGYHLSPLRGSCEPSTSGAESCHCCSRGTEKQEPTASLPTGRNPGPEDRWQPAGLATLRPLASGPASLPARQPPRHAEPRCCLIMVGAVPVPSASSLGSFFSHRFLYELGHQRSDVAPVRNRPQAGNDGPMPRRDETPVAGRRPLLRRPRSPALSRRRRARPDPARARAGRQLPPP